MRKRSCKVSPVRLVETARICYIGLTSVFPRVDKGSLAVKMYGKQSIFVYNQVRRHKHS